MAREYGFKFAPWRGYAGAITFTLPYAGASRIRFKGLPDEGVRLSVRYDRHP